MKIYQKSKNFLDLIFQSKGNSLIEIIITITILGVIVIPFTNIFITAARNNHEVEKRMYAYAIASKYLEQVKNEELQMTGTNTTVWGQEFDIESGEWIEILQDDHNYRVYGKITEVPLIETDQDEDIMNLTIEVKIMDNQRNRTWVELKTNIVLVGKVESRK